MKIRYEFENEDFEYEVDDNEVRILVSELIARDLYTQAIPSKEQDKNLYRLIAGSICYFIKSVSCETEESIFVDFQDEIKDYFEDEARKQYKECCEYERQCNEDKYDYSVFNKR